MMGSLLSVGAIDFGIIVDGAVIVADNVARRLAAETARGQRWSVPRTVLAAALEVERPVFFPIGGGPSQSGRVSALAIDRQGERA
jgi:Cu/Ag efflux pump CusA